MAQQAAVAIDSDDIGGVVRGPAGPEAGVWVIAETTELPTKFAKIVVTDDQGRYVIPDLPPNVNYQVWVRGYGLVDSPKMRAKPGQQVNLAAVPAPDEAAAAHYYPGDLLVHAVEDSAGQGFRRQHRHPEGDHAGHLAPAHEQRRLRRLPSAWPGIDADDSGCVWRIQIGRGGMDAPRCLGTNRRVDGEPAGRAARRRAVQVFRRLDRPRGQGRTAQGQAAAAGRHRAQRRDLLMGVGHRETLRPRSDFLGPAQSDRQRLRPAVRVERIFVGRHADPRSQDRQGDILQNAGRRSERPGIVRTAAASQCHRQADRRVGLLGRGEDLEPEGEQP